MTVISQRNNLGDLLKYEAPSLFSRETGTIAAGQNLSLGTVLGKAAADDKWHTLDPTASDGTETATAVLAVDIDATLADRDDALLIARHAIVARSALVWPVGLSATQKAAAEAQLATLGILVRASA